MATNDKNGAFWSPGRWNGKRARFGRSACKVGQADTRNPDDDRWTAGLDTVTNILHWLAKEGFTSSEIDEVLTAARTNFDAERAG
jgi:hypothetical protein